MISRLFIRNNVNSIAIALYLFLFALLLFIKPNFLYNNDGSLRTFGIGTSKKTIIPAWLLAIILSILSYFFVLYYLAFSKLN
jgi:quinol-cytochrome oxidoreductase complex cytochrome b subunit